MPSPFPGMDPFIESQSWLNFHSRLINGIADTLDALVQPRYWISVEDNVYLSTDEGPQSTPYKPDFAIVQEDGWLDTEDGSVAIATKPEVLTIPFSEPIEEHYLVLKLVGHSEAVTVLEVLSPTNKSSAGRREYLAKREGVLRSRANLIEIDLLRGGLRVPTVEPLPRGDYYAFVARGTARPKVDVYAWQLASKLPKIAVPLAEGDPEVTLDLQEAYELTYRRGGFPRFLQYHEPVSPRLIESDAEWVRSQLAAFSPKRQRR